MESGRMGGDTKRQGGELIVALVELRQAAGKLDFEGVAQAHSSRVLRERCGSDISAATIDALVALDIHGQDCQVAVELSAAEVAF